MCGVYRLLWLCVRVVVIVVVTEDKNVMRGGMVMVSMRELTLMMYVWELKYVGIVISGGEVKS